MDASKMSRNQQRDRVNVDDVPVGGGQAQDTEDGTSGGDGLHAGSEKTPILARGASGASPSAGYAPAGFKLELLLTLPPDHLVGADQSVQAPRAISVAAGICSGTPSNR